MLQWIRRFYRKPPPPPVYHDVVVNLCTDYLGMDLELKAKLTAAEYPPGQFRLYYQRPGDLSLYLMSHDKEGKGSWICEEPPCDSLLREVEWQDVVIGWGKCQAPSIERLREALTHVTFEGWPRSY
jgi:hypothetical protein